MFTQGLKLKWQKSSIIHPTKQTIRPYSGKESVRPPQLVVVMLTNSGNPGKPIHPMSGTSSVIASYNESEEDQSCRFHME